MAVHKAHAEDPITFNRIALNIDYALPKDYESNTPYKILYVRRLRGGKRELKWYFFSHNRHIRKMMGTLISLLSLDPRLTFAI